MYPLWKQVIAPILKASEAKRVLEIGALQGETTVKLLGLLGPESELHVIDPMPQFDPSEHQRRFPGRYTSTASSATRCSRCCRRWTPR